MLTLEYRPIRMKKVLLLSLAMLAGRPPFLAMSGVEEEGKSPPPAQKTVSPSPAPAGRAYSASGGYSIVCPAGWIKSDGAMGLLDTAFLCLSDPGVNINVTWAPAGAEGVVSDDMVKDLKEMFKKAYPDYRATAEEWRKVDGARAFCISSRYTRQGSEFQNRQVMLIKGGKFYTLAYTSVPALFMKHLGEFEQAVDSFSAGFSAGTGGGRTPAVLQSPEPATKE